MIRVLLTGGGSGGHIYPLIAVADALKRAASDNISLEISYVGPTTLYEAEFSAREIRAFRIPVGKLRRYGILSNFLDAPKFFLGLIKSFFLLYKIMPDAVFSKGGPGALPVVLAARFYFIPIVIHESDSVPGITNTISGKFAKRIGVAFAEAAKYFPGDKVALIGNPVRTELIPEREIPQHAAKSWLGFDPDKPLVLFLGGSQGALQINNFVFDNLQNLLDEFQIFHQVGPKNEEPARLVSNQMFKEYGSKKNKYQFKGHFNAETMKYALIASDIVVSRSGAGAIFEIAAFGKPSFLIPLESSARDHQKENAFCYSKTGAALVFESNNLKPHLIIGKIAELLQSSDELERMRNKAKSFFRKDSADIIAMEIISLSKK